MEEVYRCKLCRKAYMPKKINGTRELFGATEMVDKDILFALRYVLARIA